MIRRSGEGGRERGRAIKSKGRDGERLERRVDQGCQGREGKRGREEVRVGPVGGRSCVESRWEASAGGEKGWN